MICLAMAAVSVAFAQVDVVVIPTPEAESVSRNETVTVTSRPVEKQQARMEITRNPAPARNETTALVVLDNPPQRQLTKDEELSRIAMSSVELSVPIRDASLRQVIMGIAAIAKMNIVAPPEEGFSDVVNIRGTYRPLDLLNTLAKMYGFNYEYNGTAWVFFRASHNQLVTRYYTIRHNNRHKVTLSSATMEGMTSRDSRSGGSGSTTSSSAGDSMFEVNSSAIVTDIETIIGMKLPVGDKSGTSSYVTTEAAAEGNVIYIPEQNTIMVTTTLHHHELIEAYLKSVDKPQRQVRVDLIFVETSRNPSSDLGVDWNGLSGASIGIDGLDYGPVNWRRPMDSQLPLQSFVRLSDLQLALNFLSKDDKSNILQRNNVVVIENEYAESRSVIEMPYKDASYSSFTSAANGLVEGSITYQEIGTIIGISPQIVEGPTSGVNGKAIKIHFSITSSIPAGEKTIDGNTAPIIAKREYKYPVIIPNGHALAIGGLSEQVASMGNSRVPLLGDIPALGYLFKKQTKSNTVRRVIAYIVPRILDESTNEFNPHTYEAPLTVEGAIDVVNEVKPPKPESEEAIERKASKQRQKMDDRFLRAVISGDMSAVKRVARDSSWRINAIDANGNSVLHVCAWYGYDEIARWALQKGADRSLTNDLGQTARDMARARNKTSLEQML